MKIEYNMNKNRLLHSKLLIAFSVIVAAYFNKHLILLNEGFYILYVAGFLLVVFAALGRLYTTSFLGGFKSKKLIDFGPFSVVRNPLYLFSFIGVLGLSLMSNNFLIIIVVPLLFLLIYYPLIKREENYLKNYLGVEYKQYCKRVHRIVPSFKYYKNVEFVKCNQDALLSAFKDSVWWFLGVMFFSILQFI